MIILSVLFTLSSCSEPQTYVSDDLSFIVENGIKYVKIETPITFTMYSWYNRFITGYWNDRDLSQYHVYYYSTARRYPFEFLERQFELYNVTLSNGVTVKYINSYDEIIGTYCLETEFQEVEEFFTNFSWTSDIVASKDFRRSGRIQAIFSKELSEKLISLGNKYAYLKGCYYLEEYSDKVSRGLCILDENKDFYKLIFSKSVFLNDGRVVLIPIGCTVTKNDEKADYTFEDYPEELILSAEEGAEILAAHEALKEYNKKQNSE